MVHFGLSKENFAIAFGANSFGFIALTQVNQILTKRFRLVQLLRFGAFMQLTFAGILLVFGVLGAGFWWVYISLMLCIAGLGFTQPNATAIALAYQKKRAGMASAMQGAFQFSVGIFGGLLLSLFDVSPVIKIGITTTTLVAIGVILVCQLDPKLDFSKVD